MNFVADSTDDPKFVSCVEQIVKAVVQNSDVSEYFLIKVDNWFGQKWLAFNHKVMGAFGIATRDLVVPPFVPNRILSEACFSRSEDGALVPKELSKPLHINQKSDANAARKLSLLFPEAGFFWWSGNSSTNGRGSLMVYLPTAEGHLPWYVEFSGAETWHPSAIKGISAQELGHYQSG